LQKRPLCGKFSSLFFCFYDPFARIIKWVSPEKSAKKLGDNPRILLCCWASLGDLFLATSVIESIRHQWPKACIGFLCAPASACVIEENAEIDQIHKIPSWLLSGKSKIRNLISLITHSLFVYPKLISCLRKVSYDISIELHPFFPNSLPLAKRASIPRRIGFTGGGYETWLTDPVSFPEKWQYLPLLYKDLLAVLDIKMEQKKIKPRKHVSSKTAVIHVGTSDAQKKWPSVSWKEVASFLEERGYLVLFTGKGEEERKIIEEIGLGVSLCDQLRFTELVQTIKQAEVLISVDSLPIHIAARYGVPFLGIYLYSSGVELWIPEGDNFYVLIGEKCARRCSDVSHPRAIYTKEIDPSTVILQFNKLQKECLV
jgi:ADP-heptose:LPS heptosyltransferase